VAVVVLPGSAMAERPQIASEALKSSRLPLAEVCRGPLSIYTSTPSERYIGERRSSR